MALSAVEGSGSIQIKQLLDQFGTVERVFEVDRCEASSLPLFNPALASRVQLSEFRRHLSFADISRGQRAKASSFFVRRVLTILTSREIALYAQNSL